MGFFHGSEVYMSFGLCRKGSVGARAYVKGEAGAMATAGKVELETAVGGQHSMVLLGSVDDMNVTCRWEA